ncbi:MAG TPA: undecaprenyl-diphosphate phosphatase [Candidatus Paceibacterota bacterium]|nr:undecaprenyl-diphosphate phosphatase [Candidatus Paceibacterota bacterium]
MLVTIIVLSLIQGLTELLPVSSSAHLMILPWLFKISDPGLAFDVALHLGTLLALVIYFFKDWIQIIQLGLNPKAQLKTSSPYNHKTLWFLVIATLPVVIVGLVFNDQLETLLRQPLITAGSLIIFGILLWLADKYSKKTVTLDDMTHKDALFVGAAQVLALVPGVSRSGATMTAALNRNFTKEMAARFSLLLSMPAILGAALLEIKNIAAISFGTLVLAISVTALSSYLVIKFLMTRIDKIGYKGFAIYRIVLALIIILTYCLRIK